MGVWTNGGNEGQKKKKEKKGKKKKLSATLVDQSTSRPDLQNDKRPSGERKVPKNRDDAAKNQKR